jgi:tagatose 6-phosphate kinase
MILTLTPNPALDVTYHVGDIRVGAVNRVTSVSERAGGKGINVARLLAAHGVPVCALGPVGGLTGAAVRALLDVAGVAHDLTTIAGPTRRTVVVSVSGAEATGLWEPGPTLSDVEWSRVCSSLTSRLDDADVVVLSGSLPPGVPIDAYRRLVTAVVAAGVPVVLDADGEPLRHGLLGRPTAVKPNAAELATLTGVAGPDPVAAATYARSLGARDVVVSLGPDGLVALAGAEVWSVRPPMTFPGNATGAGDAAVAALALGFATGDTWPERLTRMVSWSAAAAAAPVAGEFDASVAVAVAAEVVVERRGWVA